MTAATRRRLPPEERPDEYYGDRGFPATARNRVLFMRIARRSIQVAIHQLTIRDLWAADSPQRRVAQVLEQSVNTLDKLLKQEGADR